MSSGIFPMTHYRRIWHAEHLALLAWLRRYIPEAVPAEIARWARVEAAFEDGSVVDCDGP